MTSWTPGGSTPESPYGQPGRSTAGDPFAPAYGNPAAQQWGAPPAQQYGGYPSGPMASGIPATGRGSIASMGSRLVARIIDWLIVGVPLGIIFGVVVAVAASGTSCTTDPDTGFQTCTAGSGAGAILIVDFLVIIAAVLYEVYFIGKRGATPGKRVMGVTVQDANTGQPIGMGKAFLRYIVLAVTGSICLLGYLSPFFDSSKRNQGWHDKAASDLVLSTK